MARAQYLYGEYEDPNRPEYYDENEPPAPVSSGPVTTPETPGTTPPPPETPPAPSDPWDVAPSDGNWQSWFLQNSQGMPGTPTSLISLEPKLAKHGIQVVRNASGVAGKIRLPNGQIIDVVNGASGGGRGWQWLTGDGGGEAGGGPVDLSKVSIDPTFLAPFTERAPNGVDTPFISPGAFQAPTADSILQDPSYLWRMEQGRGALENSAAARGTLNSGGTLADILNYGQKAASQEYSNVYDRKLGVWNADWTNALNTFRANKDVNDTSYQRAWQKYVDAKDTWYRNQNEPFQKLYQAATLGATAAAR